MAKKKEDKYSDFSNVVTGRNYVIPEEFPEGSYQASEGKDSPVENKSTPWRDDQRHYSAFNYEYKSLHEDMPRQYPGAHPTHDNPEQVQEPPYEDYPPQ